MFFEWILLAAATAGIASLARGRGGHPLVWAIVTVAAFFLGVFVANALWPGTVAAPFTPWALVGIVGIAVRFVLGAGLPKPDSMWSCPACSMVNEASYVVCQACQRPYGT